ncbi:hypothetical protein ED312_10600 [Sinomicrobium pectinilyticum]|uniref:Uncharacterized protein n=1 Tax=Sinomicrobium pectinilyticum TaxID=1084421 RepID=A0A3N0EH85_SINP1|nr:hypothetical protein ED312_10600 [Sinomicrobium pectinilyticum]
MLKVACISRGGRHAQAGSLSITQDAPNILVKPKGYCCRGETRNIMKGKNSMIIKSVRFCFPVKPRENCR